MERIVIRVRYRIDNGPWLIADSPDQVPPGAELHPCHLQREARDMKKPHIRTRDAESAKEHAWKDLICGSCGLPFRGYSWPPER